MREGWFGCLGVVAMTALACGETAPAGNENAGGSGSAGSEAGTAGKGALAGQSTGGNGVSGAGSAGTSAGGTGATGGTSNNDDAVGSITVQSLLFTGATRDIKLNVNYPAVSGKTPECTRENYGQFTLSHCTSEVGEEPRQHVGVITLDSPEAGVHVVTTPDDSGHYMETEDALMSFSGGEALTVTAAGATLPGFTLNGLFPLLLLVDQPVPSPTTGNTAVATLPRTQDITLAWSRGAPGVTFNVQPSKSVAGMDGSSTRLSCSFDSLAGTGTIPAAALSPFPAGTALYLLSVWHGAAAGTVVYVVSEALTPDKTAAVQIVLE